MFAFSLEFLLKGPRMLLESVQRFLCPLDANPLPSPARLSSAFAAVGRCSGSVMMLGVLVLAFSKYGINLINYEPFRNCPFHKTYLFLGNTNYCKNILPKETNSKMEERYKIFEYFLNTIVKKKTEIN